MTIIIVAEQLMPSWLDSFNPSHNLLDYHHTLLGELRSPLFRECSVVVQESQNNSIDQLVCPFCFSLQGWYSSSGKITLLGDGRNVLIMLRFTSKKTALRLQVSTSRKMKDWKMPASIPSKNKVEISPSSTLLKTLSRKFLALRHISEFSPRPWPGSHLWHIWLRSGSNLP